MAGKSHDRINRAKLIGMRSGQRTIVDVDRMERRWIAVMVKCDCGHQTWTTLGHFRQTQSCKRCADRSMVTTHGRSSEKLYGIWNGMRHRCGPHSSPKIRKHYYDKGIRVCDEWLDYEAFRTWALSNGYREGLSIDRLSPAFGYSPANCEWVSRSENNRRVHRNSTYPLGDIRQQTPPRALLLALNGG